MDDSKNSKEAQYDEKQIIETLKEKGLDGSTPNDYLRQTLGEDLYEFFYGAENAKDINNLLSDTYSKKSWETLLDKHKEGKITTEDLVDVLMISQVHSQNRANEVSSAEEIIDRSFESKLKGKLGKRIMTALVGTLSEQNLLSAPKEAVTAFLSYQTAKTDARTEPKEDQKFLPTTTEEKLNDATEAAFKNFQDSLNVNDLVRDITKEELLGRLSTENDPYFGITHQIIFDMGWEGVSRQTPNARFLSIYVCELDKAWTDTIASNIKESDRHITRYIVRDVAAGDLASVNQIRDKIMEVYYGRFQEKIDYFIKKLW